MKNTGLHLFQLEIEEIDAARGEIPRERWIRGAIRQRLERERSERHEEGTFTRISKER